MAWSKNIKESGLFMVCYFLHDGVFKNGAVLVTVCFDALIVYVLQVLQNNPHETNLKVEWMSC